MTPKDLRDAITILIRCIDDRDVLHCSVAWVRLYDAIKFLYSRLKETEMAGAA